MYIHNHRCIYDICENISTDIYIIYMKTYNWTYNACIYISTDIYLYI